MQFKLLFIIITTTLALAGCSASKLNEDQCANIDWYGLGETEGEAGQKRRKLKAEVRSCAKHGIEVDPNLYSNGWNSGIKGYCTPEIAYNLGRINKSFPNVCPDSLQAEFRDAYNRGLDNFVRVKNLKTQLNHLNKVIDKDNRAIRSLEKVLVKHDANELRSTIEQQQQQERKLEQAGEYSKATKIKLKIAKLQDTLYVNNSIEFHSRTTIEALRTNISKLIKLKTSLKAELLQLK
ncbi:MAG: hypothetical protein COC15_01070 [Legionellales bacterium]|nr:MAG: hypothetical protein COC15_01070 [Legionellales bacterium]